MNSDPFSILGISKRSSAEEIRKAWREKSRLSHPDVGGSHEMSVQLNQAMTDALLAVSNRATSEHVESGPDVSVRFSRRLMKDTSSFTIDVLPVECWHAMELVAAMCGSLLAEDPPYLIEFTLHDSGISDSVDAWCRCDMVPEAGATTVHITVGSHSPKAPSIDVVRDFLVSSLNEINWEIQ